MAEHYLLEHDENIVCLREITAKAKIIILDD
jgi:hypothetical protein